MSFQTSHTFLDRVFTIMNSFYLINGPYMITETGDVFYVDSEFKHKTLFSLNFSVTCDAYYYNNFFYISD